MMANIVEFEDYWEHECLLKRSEVKDLVDVLYRGNSRFVFHGKMHPSRLRKPTMGLHMFTPFSDIHEIYLAPQKIREFYGAKGCKTGGNTIAPNLKLAFAMTVAHELQHANQSLSHTVKDKHGQQVASTAFYGKKRSRYKTRPCEREARQFADDMLPTIASMLGIELEKDKVIRPPDDEVELVAECLAEADVVSVQDIVEELRQSGLNNVINVQRVKRLLEEWDVQLGEAVVG